VQRRDTQLGAKILLRFSFDHHKDEFANWCGEELQVAAVNNSLDR